MNKLRAILTVFFMVIIPMTILNCVLYLIGSFIAWDWNPLNWLLLSESVGRVILVILEIVFLVNSPNFFDEDFEL